MRRTTITIQRNVNGTLTTIAQHIGVDVVPLSDRELLDGRMVYQWRGVDVFKLITDYNPTTHIGRTDLLIDETYTDPETGQAMRYNPVGRPRAYDDHDEVTVEVVRGT